MPGLGRLPRGSMSESLNFPIRALFARTSATSFLHLASQDLARSTDTCPVVSVTASLTNSIARPLTIDPSTVTRSLSSMRPSGSTNRAR